MPDQHDSAQRPRPFAPPAPPFRGPATAARPAFAPLTPDAAKPPAPFIARRSAKVAEASEPMAPAAGAPHPVAAVPASPTDGEAHLYGNDPFAGAHQALSHPSPSRAVPGEDAAPAEAAQALAGLTYFDEAGSQHVAPEVEAPKRNSGKVHRIEFDPAGVLEAVATRVRAGTLSPLGLDSRASDAAVVAAVLAALLRDDA